MENIISGNLAEMCLIAEGAISLYEITPEPSSDEYSLIGDALYLIREKAAECLKACNEYEKDADDN